MYHNHNIALVNETLAEDNWLLLWSKAAHLLLSSHNTIYVYFMYNSVNCSKQKNWNLHHACIMYCRNKTNRFYPTISSVFCISSACDDCVSYVQHWREVAFYIMNTDMVKTTYSSTWVLGHCMDDLCAKIL